MGQRLPRRSGDDNPPEMQGNLTRFEFVHGTRAGTSVVGDSFVLRKTPAPSAEKLLSDACWSALNGMLFDFRSRESCTASQYTS